MNHIDVPWGLIVLLVGLAYGYFSPGRTQKWDLVKRAVLWAIVVGVVLAVIGWLLGAGALGLGLLGLGFVGIVVTIAILAIVFVLGAWIGDWIERRVHGTSGRAVRRAD